MTKSAEVDLQAPAAGTPIASETGKVDPQIEAHAGPPFTGLLFYVAIAFSLFQLVTAAFSPLSSQVVRGVHVGFLLLVCFALYAPFGIKAMGWVIGLAGFATGVYHWVFEADLVQRAGELTPADMVVGIALVVLVFEAARRVLGIALPIICGAFLLYGLFGQYVPGALQTRGFAFEQVVGQLSFGTEGIYGTPTYVSSSYIFLFILFGSFLEQAGMIKLFTDVALGLFGKSRGGPAKVAVIASAFMGTISGSGVANVVTVGQFTIPLMKRFGYKASFAGGVEATASMGGQIMPPVMGAVAFIMAETINVPYAEICKAATIPAILYFVTAFVMVHLEAGRANLIGMPADQIPNAWDALKARWYLLIPLAMLVYLLFAGYTPLFSGMVGLALTVIVIFGFGVMAGIGAFGLRVLFWIVVGIACATFFKYGIPAILAVATVLALPLFVMKGGRETLRISIVALADGAKHALPVGIACALVGIIIGVLTLTGAATTFAGYIITLGETSIFASLLLTMFVCLVLGMGIPTIPNYIITSSLAAPALLKLGVPLIVSHMFVFYFGIMADLTPPVALAAFAAAPIARESGMKIGFQAMRIAIAGFIIPYIAVYDPALMLQGDWTIASVAYVVLKTLIAIGLWGAAAIGFWRARLNPFERLFAFVTACFLVAAIPWTDNVGFALAAVFAAWHLLRTRGVKVGPATA